MDVVDNGQRRKRTRQHLQSKSSSPVKTRTSTSSNVDYVCPPGFTGCGQQMAIYRPPANSEIFNSKYQMEGLHKLYSLLLNNDENGSFRKFLIEKAFKTLGLKTLPSSETVHPFIHISDEGTPNITFLYDSPPFTPWKSYIEVMYPKEVLQLSKQIYEFLLNPLFSRNLDILQTNRNEIANGSFDSDSSTGDDLFEEEYLPIQKQSNLRCISQRTRRQPKKLLTTSIEKVFDPSDVSSIDEFVMSKRKRKRTVDEPESKKTEKKTPKSNSNKSKPRVSNVIRTRNGI